MKKPRYSAHALSSGIIVIIDTETPGVVCELRDERDANTLMSRLETHLATIDALAHEVLELKRQLRQQPASEAA